MPVPITRFKITDIQAALGEYGETDAEALFLSENVVEAGLDPIYCASLASLRTRPYDMSKWRNYYGGTHSISNIFIADMDRVGSYNILTNSYDTILNVSGGFADIAATRNKLWLFTGSILHQFALNLNPFSLTLERSIDILSPQRGSGVEAIDDETLIIGGSTISIIKITPSGYTVEYYFELPPDYHVTGDILYLPNSTPDKYLITYSKSGALKIGVFSASGVLLRSADVVSGAFAMFKDITTSKYYVTSSSGPQLYEINLNTLEQTFITILPSDIQPLGAAQIQESISCGAESSYSGGESYPSTDNIILGSGLGTVILYPDPKSLPDRFIVFYNRVRVIDTGYVSVDSSWYNLGGTARNQFKWSLQGRIDPVLGVTYPNFTHFPGDGYPLVSSIESKSFYKSLAYVTEAQVRVYAPMADTYWSYILTCPEI